MGGRCRRVRQYDEVIRRRLVFTIVVAALVPSAFANARETSGFKGRVLDVTCYGPCIYPPPESPPYTGEGLTVSVKTLPERVPVAKLHPTDGTFQLEAPAGLYRVRARFRDECWRGQRRRVQVPDGDYARVTLRVYNDCIR